MSRARLGPLLLVAALAACDDSRADAGTATPVVIFHTAVGDLRVKVEVAATPAARTRGLMYRDLLAADTGMVFVFPDDDDHVFWMKNTLIPLDMIFATRALVVAGIVANAEPLTESPRSVGVASRYVIEVNGGWAAAHGVVAGTRLSFEQVPTSVSR